MINVGVKEWLDGTAVERTANVSAEE